MFQRKVTREIKNLEISGSVEAERNMIRTAVSKVANEVLGQKSLSRGRGVDKSRARR